MTSRYVCCMLYLFGSAVCSWVCLLLVALMMELTRGLVSFSRSCLPVCYLLQKVFGFGFVVVLLFYHSINNISLSISISLYSRCRCCVIMLDVCRSLLVPHNLYLNAAEVLFSCYFWYGFSNFGLGLWCGLPGFFFDVFVYILNLTEVICALQVHFSNGEFWVFLSSVHVHHATFSFPFLHVLCLEEDEYRKTYSAYHCSMT